MNWAERLVLAEEHGHFTIEDRSLSMTWTSCAVGEHRGQYPETKWTDAEPGVIEIYELGMDFYHHVVIDDNIDEARETYNKIQAWFKEREPIILYPMMMDLAEVNV